MRFVLIDEILEMIPGRSITAIKAVSADEDFFADHFPGFPVVPGVLLTEMMAQTAGKCLDAADRQRGKSMLAQIKLAQFRDWMGPGQSARIHAEILLNRPQYATAKCHVTVGGREVCSAELLFSFVTMDKFQAGYRDEVLEQFLARPASSAASASPLKPPSQAAADRPHSP